MANTDIRSTSAVDVTLMHAMSLRFDAWPQFSHVTETTQSQL